MEFFASIFNIFLAFALTTILGYGYWYVTFGRRLKKRHEDRTPSDSPKRNNARRDKKSDAERINETMGYDFIPMRSVSRAGAAEHESPTHDAGTKAAPVTVEGTRSWSDSQAEGFTERETRLGVSAEPEQDDYYPEYSEEEARGWESNLERWEKEAALLGTGDDEAEDDGDDDDGGDTPLQPDDDIWDSMMDERARSREDVRKRSNAIHELEDEEGEDDDLGDYQIDYGEE